MLGYIWVLPPAWCDFGEAILMNSINSYCTKRVKKLNYTLGILPINFQLARKSHETF